jgi:N-acetylmuramoyl-L-alanine amidase
VAVKVAVIVGHDRERQGARGVDGITEHAWNSGLADDLVCRLAHLGVLARRFDRQPGPVIERWADCAADVGAWGATLAIELHFDAAPPPHAGQWRGSTGLHWPGSPGGASWAARLSRASAQAIGTRDRGARPQSHSHSGVELVILRRTRCPAVILETHYGDNQADRDGANAALRSGALAVALAQAVQAGT